MLRFREFLKESTWNKLLYHSTSKQFHPSKMKSGSHFGDLGTAVSRGIDRTYDPEDYSRDVMSFGYKPRGMTVRVKDNWSDEAPEVHFGKTLAKKGILSKAEAAYIRQRSINPTKDMGRLLKKRGISTVKYKNKLEGGGTDSTIVYDPENLSHYHTFKSPNVIEPKKQPELGDSSGWNRLERRRRVFGTIRRKKNGK